jgi:DNA invertase Pin-like site-specific DNA recombinase
MKVALYTRVSTREQSDAMQLRELQAFATVRGFEVEREYQKRLIS